MQMKLKPIIYLGLIILTVVIVRIPLLDIPLERDEGDYAYTAQLILEGIPLHAELVRIRYPGISLIYATFLALFGQTIRAVHLGLLITNIATICLLYILGEKIIGSMAGVAAVACFAILTLCPTLHGFAANREHFVIFFSLGGIILLLNALNRQNLFLFFLSGLLFGAAFLVKQHSAAFIIFAGLFIIHKSFTTKPIAWKRLLKTLLIFSAGVLILYGLICLYYFHGGAFERFWFRTTIYTKEYVSIQKIYDGLLRLKNISKDIFNASRFLWCFIGLGFVTIFFNNRVRGFVFLLVSFFLFSLISIFPGFYFRNHYFILLLPSASLLYGITIRSICDVSEKYISHKHAEKLATIIALITLILPLYNQRNYLFKSTPEEACRLEYGYNPFPEAVRIGEYIRKNTNKDDKILILGSEPEILFYSQRRTAIKEIYMYQLMELSNFAEFFQKKSIKEAEISKPKIIVFVRVDISWLMKKESCKLIFDWIKQYLKQYRIVGVVDMLPEGTEYYFDQEAIGYQPRVHNCIFIYKRKDI